MFLRRQATRQTHQQDMVRRRSENSSALLLTPRFSVSDKAGGFFYFPRTPQRGVDEVPRRQIVALFVLGVHAAQHDRSHHWLFVVIPNLVSAVRTRSILVSSNKLDGNRDTKWTEQILAVDSFEPFKSALPIVARNWACLLELRSSHFGLLLVIMPGIL